MTASRPRRVLIADDDRMLRDIAAATLEKAGFEVVTAESAQAAAAACTAQMPDLALFDVEMPPGDGFQACAHLRAQRGGSHVPVVMITGLEDPQSIDRAYKAGATDFMIKPVNWPLLVRRIEYILRGAQTQDALRESMEHNAAMLRLMPDGLFLVDGQGVITKRFNASKSLIRAQSSRTPEPTRLVEFLPFNVHALAMERLAKAIRGNSAAFDFSVGDAGRGLRHFECRLQPKSSGFVLVVLRDVTQSKESEGRMRRLAYVDALTGLANREWINTYLGKVVARAERRQQTCAVLFVDLDGFKRVNDTLGHETGDALLAQVAGRLRSALGYCRRRYKDAESSAGSYGPGSQGINVQLARLGGDEFIAVLSGGVTTESAETAARQIRAELNVPFSLAGYEVSVTPSIGIAMSPLHGSDAKALLKNADAAMYLAKSSGKNQYRFYDDTLKVRAQLRGSLEAELREALGTDQLQVVYQPKYCIRTLQIVGAEALLRWVHPTQGTVPSSDLMAVAEETGLISELDTWVLTRACKDLNSWRKEDVTLTSMSLNVSAREFLRPGMPLRFNSVIEEEHLKPSMFELELSEAVLMRDADVARRTLHSLKQMGFTLAMDDFGSGQCSFNSLKQLPLDTLKIAALFVEEILKDPGNLAIVRAIIALGRKLDMRVAAKGVATIAQLQFLREENCDFVQGFLLSPPVGADRFSKLVQSYGPSTQTLRALQIAASERDEAPEFAAKSY
jgi:predicted signal transduction protein with EAL and GGDEF domain/DNA-binding response OmpR family regulator